MASLIETFKIIVLCIASAVVYGILHDQVTARVCVEYFTIGHDKVFDTESPTLLAIGWGFIATWWVGFFLGIPAAIVSLAGSWPKYDARRLLRPIGVLLSVMACAALLSGILAYRAAAAGHLGLLEPLASRIPESKHAAFVADGTAHLTSYGVGCIGGLSVCFWVVIQRRRMARRVMGPGSTQSTAVSE